MKYIFIKLILNSSYSYYEISYLNCTINNNKFLFLGKILSIYCTSGNFFGTENTILQYFTKIGFMEFTESSKYPYFT